MKKSLVTVIILLLLLTLHALKNGRSERKASSFTDSVTIVRGEMLFNEFCSGCHNFKQDGIGPQLGGLTTQVPAEWIKHFIKDPQKLIGSADERASRLVKKYKSVMPSFPKLTDQDLNSIIAFLHTQKLPEFKEVQSGNELSNPIREAIQSSGLVVGLQLVTQLPPSADSGKWPMTRITKLDYQPGTGTSFVLDLRGKLYKLLENKPTVYMDMAVLKPAFIHQPGLATGFGSFAFHPSFVRNGLLYTTHTEPAGSAKADFYYADSIKVTLQWVLTEWKAENPGAAVFAGTGRELMRVNMVAVNHGVQEITFNQLAKPNDEDYGLLYIGVGDGGSVEHGYPFLVHNPEMIWGTILRIDPAGRTSTNGKYGIPPQNPFAKRTKTKALGEIYAYGFRNPHRITFTNKKQMLACNIGHGNIESVNLIMKGYDYGWPIREGSFLVNPYGNLNKVFPLPVKDSSHVTYPVAQYDHDEGRAISGGFEYTGKTIPGLNGKYVFGDIYTGRLFFIGLADVKSGSQAPVKDWKVTVNGTIETLAGLCGRERVDLHFGRDAQGELYVLTKADGKVYKLVNATNLVQNAQ